MKLSKEFKVVLAGMVVSLMTLLVGFFAKPVQAAGCGSGACTYYSGGAPYSGQCGMYDHNTLCGCTYGTNGQPQSACGAPPAP